MYMLDAFLLTKPHSWLKVTVCDVQFLWSVPEIFVVALEHLHKLDKWFKRCLLVHNQNSLNQFLEQMIVLPQDALERCSLCLNDRHPGRFLYCDPSALTTLGRTASRAQRGPALCAWGQGSTEGWTGWGNWLSDTAESRRSTTRTRIMLGVSSALMLFNTAVDSLDI